MAATKLAHTIVVRRESVFDFLVELLFFATAASLRTSNTIGKRCAKTFAIHAKGFCVTRRLCLRRRESRSQRWLRPAELIHFLDRRAAISQAIMRFKLRARRIFREEHALTAVHHASRAQQRCRQRHAPTDSDMIVAPKALQSVQTLS